jgi:hypothetical protein
MASMSPRVCKLVLWVIAAFYAYGALVHLMNMAGFSGFDWRTAPLKWQVLDIAYLGLLYAAACLDPRRAGGLCPQPR